jgi:2-iminobutanoate/2-iminopropanoate deaminase
MDNLPFSSMRSSHGNFVFLSGQVGHKDGKLVSDDFKEQTRQAIANVEITLATQGMSLTDVVDVLVFLIDPADYGPFNQVYAEFFHEPYPTRTCIGASWLPLGAKIEIKVLASSEVG